MGAEDLKLTKQKLDWPLEPSFYVPDEVLNHLREAIERGEKADKEWTIRFDAYAKEYPDLAVEWQKFKRG